MIFVAGDSLLSTGHFVRVLGAAVCVMRVLMLWLAHWPSLPELPGVWCCGVFARIVRSLTVSRDPWLVVIPDVWCCVGTCKQTTFIGLVLWACRQTDRQLGTDAGTDAAGQDSRTGDGGTSEDGVGNETALAASTLALRRLHLATLLQVSSTVALLAASSSTHWSPAHTGRPQGQLARPPTRPDLQRS